LVMRGNLDFFLQRQSAEANASKATQQDSRSPEMAGYFG